MADTQREHGVERALDWLLSPFAIAAGLMLGLLSLMVTTDVIVRWVTGRPLIGVFESAEAMLVYCTFFALAYVQFRNQQLRVDILSARATGRVAGVLRVIECVASVAMYGAIVWYTGREWIKAYNGGFLRRGMLEIPTTVLLSPIVIGAALVIIVLLWQLAGAIRQVATGIDERPAPPSLEGSI